MSPNRQILNAREHRWLIQQDLLKKYQTPVVSITVNKPGANKNDENVLALLRYTVKTLHEQCRESKTEILEERWIYDPGGYAAILAVEAGATELKRMCIRLEEEESFSRLLDLDVFAGAGMKISRKELGVTPRSCWICGEEAVLCVRSGKHSFEQVRQKYDSYIIDFLAKSTRRR